MAGSQFLLTFSAFLYVSIGLIFDTTPKQSVSITDLDLFDGGLAAARAGEGGDAER